MVKQLEKQCMTFLLSFYHNLSFVFLHASHMYIYIFTPYTYQASCINYTLVLTHNLSTPLFISKFETSALNLSQA